MKLATIRTPEGTKAVRVEGDTFVDLGVDSVSTLLASEDWQAKAAADGPALSAEGADFAPVTPAPGKIICVGLNYRTHITEMGRELPEHPTLFAKYPEARIEDSVNGETKQSDTTGGVGHARKPAQYLVPGDVLVTEIEGLGRCENRAVAEVVA